MSKLFAVRTSFDDVTGAATHEYLFGQDPTVFLTRDAAEQHAQQLNDSAKDIEWGSCGVPSYHVEEIEKEDMDPAEVLANNE